MRTTPQNITETTETNVSLFYEAFQCLSNLVAYGEGKAVNGEADFSYRWPPGVS